MIYINAMRMDMHAAQELDSGDYTAQLPVVRALQQMDWFRFRSSVTFFAGENGSGKSTLLEALAVCAGMNAEGGSRNYNFATNRTESELHRRLSVARSERERDSYFLRAESFYNAASYIDQLELAGSYGGKSLHEQSHGESFLALVQNRLNCGLYILDEPEAALSPTRQMTLLVEMDRLVRAGSQLIIATHSPILLAFPGAEIYELTGDDIRLTPYTETTHYQITRRFLNDTQHMLRLLGLEQQEEFT